MATFDTRKEEILSINGFDLNVDELEHRLELNAVISDYACGANACGANASFCGANACGAYAGVCPANLAP